MTRSERRYHALLLPCKRGGSSGWPFHGKPLAATNQLLRLYAAEAQRCGHQQATPPPYTFSYIRNAGPCMQSLHPPPSTAANQRQHKPPIPLSICHFTAACSDQESCSHVRVSNWIQGHATPHATPAVFSRPPVRHRLPTASSRSCQAPPSSDTQPSIPLDPLHSLADLPLRAVLGARRSLNVSCHGQPASNRLTHPWVMRHTLTRTKKRRERRQVMLCYVTGSIAHPAAFR